MLGSTDGETVGDSLGDLLGDVFGLPLGEDVDCASHAGSEYHSTNS